MKTYDHRMPKFTDETFSLKMAMQSELEIVVNLLNTYAKNQVDNKSGFRDL